MGQTKRAVGELCKDFCRYESWSCEQFWGRFRSMLANTPLDGRDGQMVSKTGYLLHNASPESAASAVLDGNVAAQRRMRAHPAGASHGCRLA
jgi:hypothetical protein